MTCAEGFAALALTANGNPTPIVPNGPEWSRWPGKVEIDRRPKFRISWPSTVRIASRCMRFLISSHSPADGCRRRSGSFRWREAASLPRRRLASATTAGSGRRSSHRPPRSHDCCSTDLPSPTTGMSMFRGEAELLRIEGSPFGYSGTLPRLPITALAVVLQPQQLREAAAFRHRQTPIPASAPPSSRMLAGSDKGTASTTMLSTLRPHAFLPRSASLLTAKPAPRAPRDFSSLKGRFPETLL